MIKKYKTKSMLMLLHVCPMCEYILWGSIISAQPKKEYADRIIITEWNLSERLIKCKANSSCSWGKVQIKKQILCSTVEITTPPAMCFCYHIFKQLFQFTLIHILICLILWIHRCRHVLWLPLLSCVKFQSHRIMWRSGRGLWRPAE